MSPQAILDVLARAGRSNLRGAFIGNEHSISPARPSREARPSVSVSATISTLRVRGAGPVLRGGHDG